MGLTYNGWTAEKLLDFEDEIRKDFLDAKIRYPIHLSHGNECNLIDIFAKYDIAHPENWVFSTHRSHLHALLKGIPPDWLKVQIHRGNSMHIMSPEYKFFSSSIVGGCCPIAVGVAMGIKRQGLKGHVFVFVGDMCSLTGIYHESITYAKNFGLPISFVIECNGMSTNTPSYETLNINHIHNYAVQIIDSWDNGKIMRYCYERLCPHINVGQFVSFH